MRYCGESRRLMRGRVPAVTRRRPVEPLEARVLLSAVSAALPALPAPVLSDHSSIRGVANLAWTEASTNAVGFEVDVSTAGGPFVAAAKLLPNATTYEAVALDPAKTYQYEVKALGDGANFGDSAFSNVVTPNTAGMAAPPAINFANFASGSGLQLNGSAALTGAGGTPANALRLTDAGPSEAGSAFDTSRQFIDKFTLSFEFTFGTAHPADGEGFTFTIQDGAPTALGAAGGSLGYEGIRNSVAIAFVLDDNGPVSEVGTASGGTNVKGNTADVTPAMIDFHANPGDKYKANIAYDGAMINATLTDETTGAMAPESTAIDIPALVGSHAGYVGFTGGTGTSTAEQDILSFSYSGTASPITLPAPSLSSHGADQGEADLFFREPLNDQAGLEIDVSTDGGTTFTPFATVPGNATSYMATGLDPTKNYTFQVKALGNGSNIADSAPSSPTSVMPAAVTSQPIDFSSGFPSNNGIVSGMVLNGSASATTILDPVPDALQLTPNMTNQAGSAFATGVENITGFQTEFTFTYPLTSTPPADGFAFVIQNDPGAFAALGPAGGGLGYGPDTNANGNAGGIINSIAVKFDLYNNQGEGTDSTGLFVNGDAPTVPLTSTGPEASVDMSGSGVQLGTSDTYDAKLVYDGTTLTETVTDTDTSRTFTHSYVVNIPQWVKSNYAWVGFTGGTGGKGAEQDVLAWTFMSSPVEQPFVINGTSGNDTIMLAKDSDGSQIDWTLNGGAVHKLAISNPNGLTINGNGGTDTIILDSSNGDPLPNLLKLNGTFTINGLSASTVGAGQTIDLGKSSVSIAYSGASLLPAVQKLLASGYDAGKWDGAGIISSAAASDSKFGIADVDSGSAVMLSYALKGDASLNGKVAFEDLVALARNYGKSGADWSKGDFDYNGKVDFADLVILARNYGASAATAFTPAATTMLSPPIPDDPLRPALRHRRTGL